MDKSTDSQIASEHNTLLSSHCSFRQSVRASPAKDFTSSNFFRLTRPAKISLGVERPALRQAQGRLSLPLIFDLPPRSEIAGASWPFPLPVFAVSAAPRSFATWFAKL